MKLRKPQGVQRVQRVQVYYRHSMSGRTYAYEWHGWNRLLAGDIVVLPPTSQHPDGPFVLGVVTDDRSHYKGECATILYAIRGEFVR